MAILHPHLTAVKSGNHEVHEGLEDRTVQEEFALVCPGQGAAPGSAEPATQACALRGHQRDLSVFFVSFVVLERERHVEPSKSRRHNRRRVQPRHAVRRIGKIRIERGRIVGVEQVVEIDTDVGLCRSEPQDQDRLYAVRIPLARVVVV